MSTIDRTYGARRNKEKKFSLPLMIVKIQVILSKQKAENEITNLLAALGLVFICDK